MVNLMYLCTGHSWQNYCIILFENTVLLKWKSIEFQNYRFVSIKSMCNCIRYNRTNVPDTGCQITFFPCPYTGHTEMQCAK
ncbi:hypothetical protein FKM82_000825 [Ascaphus truei]